MYMYMYMYMYITYMYMYSYGVPAGLLNCYRSSRPGVRCGVVAYCSSSILGDANGSTSCTIDSSRLSFITSHTCNH